MVLFHISVVEDKVKDQLEAANPEPVIEEVVSWIFPQSKVSVFKHDAKWTASVSLHSVTLLVKSLE